MTAGRYRVYRVWSQSWCAWIVATSEIEARDTMHVARKQPAIAVEVVAPEEAIHVDTSTVSGVAAWMTVYNLRAVAPDKWEQITLTPSARGLRVSAPASVWQLYRGPGMITANRRVDPIEEILPPVLDEEGEIKPRRRKVRP